MASRPGVGGVAVSEGRGRAVDRRGRAVPYLRIRPDGPPLGVVAFAHGFLCPPWLNAGTLRAWAAAGLAVVAPVTRAGPWPSHAGLAGDLRAVLVAESAVVRRETGRLPRIGLAGYSMGGGCAVLAAAGWPAVGEPAGLPPIAALVLISPMRTVPSTWAAAPHVRAPVLTVVGSADRIVPTATSRAIHDRLAGRREWVALDGGSHCGFLDRAVPFCDRGPLPRERQLEQLRDLTRTWLIRQVVGADGGSGVAAGPAG